MEVELYVYDLSRGMARQYSMALTGVQINAIYHTAIVLNNVEYFFGQGVHRKVPGSTHHGRPVSVIKLGVTDLPLDVIEEYIQSLEAIYTPESYDLFLHNCNNFSQDLSMFLVGKEIPEEIRILPETFLRTPMGQMMRGQIDQSMRTMTQAPDAVAGSNVSAGINGPARAPKLLTSNGVSKPVQLAAFINGKPVKQEAGQVFNVTALSELQRLLQRAQSTCAVVFFTSATCPPCKTVYPAYDQLAADAGSKAILIKVDISRAYEIAVSYSVRATPTFVSFLKGQKQDEWTGANEAKLRGNVRLLIQMAHPQHSHSRLRLPTFQRLIEKPAMYTKIPPLDKLQAKIGVAANDEALRAIFEFIKKRDTGGMIEAPLPNLHALSDYLLQSIKTLPQESHFAVIDLVRVSAADSRVSSFIAAEPGLKLLSTLAPPSNDLHAAPYNIQAVTLQLLCNLFGSNVFQEGLLQKSSPLRTVVEKCASEGLLAKHHNARSLAAALVYNLAAYDHNERIEGRPDKLNLSEMGDLEAAIVEATVNESENKETLHSILQALGMILYGAPADASIWDLCSAMDVQVILSEKSKAKIFSGEPLLKEVGKELLGSRS